MFDFTLDLDRPSWAGPASIEEYRFDREHNSPFRLIRAILDRPDRGGQRDAVRLADVIKGLESDRPAAQRLAIETLKTLDPRAQRAALESVFRIAGQTKDQGIRDAAVRFVRSVAGPTAYPAADVETIRQACECHPTGKSRHTREADGHLRITVRVASNGCNFVIIKPDDARPIGGEPCR